MVKRTGPSLGVEDEQRGGGDLLPPNRQGKDARVPTRSSSPPTFNCHAMRVQLCNESRLLRERLVSKQERKIR